MSKWIRIIAKYLWVKVPYFIFGLIVLDWVYDTVSKSYYDYRFSNYGKDKYQNVKHIWYEIKWYLFGPWFISWFTLLCLGIVLYLLEPPWQEAEEFTYSMAFLLFEASISTIFAVIFFILHRKHIYKVHDCYNNPHKFSKLNRWLTILMPGPFSYLLLLIVIIYYYSHY